MDLELTPTPTSTKTHENTEIDTPPHTIHPIKPFLSYTNGALKNHRHHKRRHPPPSAVIKYKECMKNHAANIGGHAVDGCGEFMPLQTSLKCAACGCHRNFHRREPESPTITPPFLDFRHPTLPKRFSLSPSPPPPPPYGEAQVLFGLRTAEEHHQAPVTPTAEMNYIPGGRKRFRTKFSQEQKEKMRSFSVRVGWKMQKCDETAVRDFCREIGVTKGVLKVWMHNNKNTFGKKDVQILNSDGTMNNGGWKTSEEKILIENGVHFHSSNNGSSSSSP